MWHKKTQALKAGRFQQPGANDDTTGKVWPGVHAENWQMINLHV